MAKVEDFEELNKRLLDEDFKFKSPIKVDGSIAYVE